MGKLYLGDKLVYPYVGDDYVFANQSFSFDGDAAAFLTATGIGLVNDPISLSINNLVVDLKADGLWTKLFCIYPFVGGTATTHKYNLKDPRDTDTAARLDFNGTITHSSNGIVGDGTSGYYDTHIDWSYSGWGQNDCSMFVYIRNNVSEEKVDIGILDTASPYTGLIINARDSSDDIFVRNMGASSLTVSNTDSRGGFATSRTSSTTAVVSKRTTQTSFSETSNAQKTGNIYGLAMNLNGSPGFYSTKQQAFSALGVGLTNAELDDLYNNVQSFQTELGREV